MKRYLLTLIIALLGAATALSGQESVQGLPSDVFYLMPKMGRGTVRFSGKPAVNGQFNICAIDNTVRFLDKNGTELAMGEDRSLVEVIIDGVHFLPKDGIFYRMEKINDDIYVAVRRDVTLLTDNATASYGMESNTTAVQSIMSVQNEGHVINFEDAKDIPYRMSETASLCKSGTFLQPNKKNFQKCFPGKKDEIEAWFKENKKPNASDPKQIIELAKSWAE